MNKRTDKSDFVLNTKVEMRRGVMMLCILHSLQNKQYGYSLIRYLEGYGIFIGADTLYPLLRRLDRQGILSSEWDTSSSNPRKYYMLTEQGYNSYRLLRDDWYSLTANINKVLNTGGEMLE